MVCRGCACFGIFSRRQEHPCRWGRREHLWSKVSCATCKLHALPHSKSMKKMPSLQISLSTSGCCLLSKLAAGKAKEGQVKSNRSHPRNQKRCLATKELIDFRAG